MYMEGKKEFIHLMESYLKNNNYYLERKVIKRK